MNALWNSLPVPALLLNPDDTIAQSNPAAEAFLNLSTRALKDAILWDTVMIDAELERMMGDFEQRLQQQGMNLDLYFQFSGQDEEAAHFA